MKTDSFNFRLKYFALHSVTVQAETATDGSMFDSDYCFIGTGIYLQSDSPSTTFLLLFNVIILHIYVGVGFYLNFHSILKYFRTSQMFCCLTLPFAFRQVKQNKRNIPLQQGSCTRVTSLTTYCKQEMKSEIPRQGASLLFFIPMAVCIVRVAVVGLSEAFKLSVFPLLLVPGGGTDSCSKMRRSAAGVVPRYHGFILST